MSQFAKQNPGTVVYLKPRRHRSPVLVAEYLNGESHWQSLQNLTGAEVITTRYYSDLVMSSLSCLFSISWATTVLRSLPQHCIFGSDNRVHSSKLQDSPIGFSLLSALLYYTQTSGMCLLNTFIVRIPPKLTVLSRLVPGWITTGPPAGRSSGVFPR